jgi:hypothetical protein
MARIEHRLAVCFDPGAWDEDLARAPADGRVAARAARKRYEQSDIALSQLRMAQDEGTDGTALPHCAKVYLPPPAGKFGMVFEVVLGGGQLRLEYIAFGVRHHPRDSHAPTVYQLAHRRLHETLRSP